MPNPQPPIEEMLKEELSNVQKYFAPVEVHTHFMGVLPVEKLVNYVTQNGFNHPNDQERSQAVATDPETIFGAEGASLLEQCKNKETFKSELGLYLLLSLGLVQGYENDKDKFGGFYPLMVSLISAIWMQHILKTSSKSYYPSESSLDEQKYYYVEKKPEDTSPNPDKPEEEKGKYQIQDFSNVCREMYKSIVNTIEPQRALRRGAAVTDDQKNNVKTIASWALGAMLMASKCTPFSDSYEVRDVFAKYYGYQAYAKETVRFLVKEEGIRYAEQAIGLGKLTKSFTLANWEKWKEDDPEFNKFLGKETGQIDIRWLITLGSSALFQKGAKTGLQEALNTPEKPKTYEDLGNALRERPDVIGIDIAQPEKPFEQTVAKKNFKELYKLVHNAATFRQRPLVLRPHVGEGSGLTQDAQTFLQRALATNTVTDFFYQVDMIFRADKKVAQQPQAEDERVLTMLLMHLSPEHFRIAAGLAEDKWWLKTAENINEYLGVRLSDDDYQKKLQDLPAPMKKWIDDIVQKQKNRAEHLPDVRGRGSAVSQGPTLNFEEICDFSQTNMTVLLDALKELTLSASMVIVRFGHATHATKEIVERMGKLGVHSEGNLGSNGRTGSIQFDWRKTEQQTMRNYLDKWWNYKPQNLIKHPLYDFFNYGKTFPLPINLILSTDGQGVENTRLKYEYAAAGLYCTEKGLSPDYKAKLMLWLQKSANSYWAEKILPYDESDRALGRRKLLPPLNP